ncbi:MAG: prolipoprotein diacylglyceryl transferase [Clostridia bacterium]
MLAIDRVAFSIFGLDIYWYAIIITCGMILGVIVALTLTKKRGLKTDDIMDIMLWTIPIAIIGARLYYVAFEWDSTWTFAKIFDTRNGGLAIYGAVLFGALTAVLVCRYKKLSLRQVFMFLDCFVVGVILGQCIGRWGNFINQEAFGNLITNEALMFFPYGVNIDGLWYQATFFYESMWNLVGFICLFIFAYKKPNIVGVSTCSYFIFYGIGRFWIEGLRSDSLYFMKETLGEVIRVSQVLSLVLVLAGAIVLFFVIKRNIAFNKKQAELSAQGESVIVGNSIETTDINVENTSETADSDKKDNE